MELLPSSTRHRIGKSDCAQQVLGKSFVYNKESNGNEHKDLVQGSCTDNLPNTDSRGTGFLFSNIEIEGQINSLDSHESEDENLNGHDFTIESLLAPETIEIIKDTNNSELVSDNKDCESRWLEHDEAAPLWVKWKGKWQTGIRCARADWPLSSVKAKPADGKNYLVIFFPHTKNYVWADVLLLRPIQDFPKPIAYEKHKVGVKMVKDTTLASRFIIKKLAVGMVNIIDRLKTKALVENARNIMVWKEFAIETSGCKGYFDLGKMLLKLKNMLLNCYLKSDWLQHSLHSWTQQCHNAESAESVELLREEFFYSVLWEEIDLLPDTLEQLDLVSEWKNIKSEILALFSSSHHVPMSNVATVLQNDSPLPTEFQLSRKRPKLEVRRADMHSALVDNHILNQDPTIEIDAGFFSGRDMATEQVENNPTTIWGEIIVQNSENILGNGEETKKSPDFGKNRQCQAFIEAKGRQCVRWANDGDVYCCVHLASRFIPSGVKTEISNNIPSYSPMCNGTTVLNTKCKHRALAGFSFCKKHRPHIDKNMVLASPNKKLKRNYEEFAEKSGIDNFNNVSIEDGEAPLEVDPISFRGIDRVSNNGRGIVKHDDNEIKYCLGLRTPEEKDSCLESPKKLGLYCEKHLPSWLKRARNGKSRILTKEVFIELLKGCHSLEQKIDLHQACDLFYRLFKSVLNMRNPVPKEVQFQWALSEATKDVKVGEFLMKLVRSEIGRLQLIWGFDADKETQDSSFIKNYIPGPVYDYGLENIGSSIRCKLCSGSFADNEALGKHWIEKHKKEAQWLFRGYVCAICLDSFTNKKGLENHVLEKHNIMFAEQCMLLQCIPCGGHFGRFDQLWLHVLSVHSSELRSSEDGQRIDGQDSFLDLDFDTENSNSSRRFICKLCGLKFDMLPDLGRHHQAAHMGASSIVPRNRKGIRFYSYRLKTGRLTRPSFRKGLGVAANRIRNKATANIKKRILANRAVSEVKVLSNIEPELGALGRLTELECSSVANILFSEIQKTKPRPSNLEILNVARSTCCKVGLQSLLEEKYGVLPERLYLKAAKLCSENHIIVEWHKVGFICPKGCERKNDSYLANSVLALTENYKGCICSDDIDCDKNEWEMDECHYVIDSRHIKQSFVPKSYILCDDISFGKELYPIMCVVDETFLDFKINAYTSPWENFTYGVKPLVGTSVGAELQGLQLSCACTNSSMCSPATCDHVYLFDNDYEDAKDIYGKPMLGRFPYDENRRLVLEDGYLVYECNNKCSCSKSCPNRVLQSGINVRLEVFKSEKKGWGVRAQETIPQGSFVCEFIGEVINEQESNKRNNSYGGQGWGYFYNMDGHFGDLKRLTEEPVPYIIDAMKYGNISRYINHSCSPNLTSRQVVVESMDCQLAHVGFFASRDIAEGEEITYGYNYKLQPGEGQTCFCEASNCRGRLY